MSKISKNFFKKEPKLVAELCCNHQGDINIAKKMIFEAKKAGADYTKFQKWAPLSSLTKKEYNTNHPFPPNSFAEPYGKHREFLEFSIEQHKELFNYASSLGIKYSCSVFDSTSAKQISSLNPEYIKVGSQKNLKFDIYEVLGKEFGGDIHISTGMTTSEQIDQILNHIEKYTNLKRVVIYSTTSSYPCKYEELYLLRISELINNYSDIVKGFGFSGHHNGIAADIAAITLGAEFIERHFTLDRTMKGTDHAASLEPQGLSKLSRDLKNVFSALKIRPNSILDVELEAFTKVKKDDWDKIKLNLNSLKN